MASLYISIWIRPNITWSLFVKSWLFARIESTRYRVPARSSISFVYSARLWRIATAPIIESSFFIGMLSIKTSAFFRLCSWILNSVSPFSRVLERKLSVHTSARGLPTTFFVSFMPRSIDTADLFANCIIPLSSTARTPSFNDSKILSRIWYIAEQTFGSYPCKLLLIERDNSDEIKSSNKIAAIVISAKIRKIWNVSDFTFSISIIAITNPV